MDHNVQPNKQPSIAACKHAATMLYNALYELFPFDKKNMHINVEVEGVMHFDVAIDDIAQLIRPHSNLALTLLLSGFLFFIIQPSTSNILGVSAE